MMVDGKDARSPSSEKTKAEEVSTARLFKELSSGKDGLSEDEAGKRLEKYGPNVLEEKRENPLLKFLGCFWGPIPWMIEAAAILSLVVRRADMGVLSRLGGD